MIGQSEDRGDTIQLNLMDTALILSSQESNYDEIPSKEETWHGSRRIMGYLWRENWSTGTSTILEEKGTIGKGRREGRGKEEESNYWYYSLLMRAMKCWGRLWCRMVSRRKEGRRGEAKVHSYSDVISTRESTIVHYPTSNQWKTGEKEEEKGEGMRRNELNWGLIIAPKWT